MFMVQSTDLCYIKAIICHIRYPNTIVFHVYLKIKDQLIHTYSSYGKIDAIVTPPLYNDNHDHTMEVYNHSPEGVAVPYFSATASTGR